MIDNLGTLKIDSSLDNNELTILSKEILINIEKIKKVELEGSDLIASSALFSLLVSIKKTNSNILIPLLDEESNFASLGDVSFTIKD